jgi:hypothetical protein
MSNTASKTLPLQQAKNVKTSVQFYDMPDEYTLINREDAEEWRGAQETFAKHPDAQTLMILYAERSPSPISILDSRRMTDEEKRQAEEYERGYPRTFYTVRHNGEAGDEIVKETVTDARLLLRMAMDCQPLFETLEQAEKYMENPYPEHDSMIRSIYQSPAKFDNDERSHPKKSPEMFYHVSGEKLVNLVMEVGHDLSAYGQNNVMIPQGASLDEVRDMAANRARSLSNWDDPFEFQEDWSTAEGLRINRLVEVVQEPGQKNRAKNIAQDIPVVSISEGRMMLKGNPDEH